MNFLFLLRGPRRRFPEGPHVVVHHEPAPRDRPGDGEQVRGEEGQAGSGSRGRGSIGASLGDVDRLTLAFTKEFRKPKTTKYDTIL